MKTESLTTNKLVSKSIQIEPIRADHFDLLKSAADDERIWAYMPMKAYGSFFNEWFHDCLTQQSQGTQITYSIRRLAEEDIVGSIAYYDIDEQHKRLEIGYGWIMPAVWGTHIIHEAVWLMLKNAFEKENFNRVQIAADPRNTRSCNFLRKLGAIQEGLLRQHMIHHNGRVTDTVVFSILKNEWRAVNDRLEFRLNKIFR